MNRTVVDLIVLVLFALAIAMLPLRTHAQPWQPVTCAGYWDVAITARALAVQGVDKEASRRAIWATYGPLTSKEDVIFLRYGNVIIDMAFAKDLRGDPGPWAYAIRRVCERHLGDMHTAIGEGT